MHIYDLVTKNNRENGQKTALSIALASGGTRIYTYSEMFAEADLLAGALLERGLNPGDRVALISENSPEWIIAFLGILKARGTAVLLDASLLPDALFELSVKSDLRCIFASPRIMDKLSGTFPAGMPVLNIYAHNRSSVDTGEMQPLPKPMTDGDETIAAIIYSSGTTRAAAGIMHSHDALISSTMMCAKSNRLTAEGKYLDVVPNSHIYGLICGVLGPMLLGADAYFMEQNTPAAILKAFAEYRPTIFPCVPKVFELFKAEIEKKISAAPGTKKLFAVFFPICLYLRKRTGINLGKILFRSIHDGFGGRIEVLCSAGAPMDQKTAEFYLGTGFNMLVTYGATETNIPTIGNYGRKLTADSCGKPYPDVSVKISESGEILIKSEYMMKGYFGEPELTAAAFEDGWFKTGDLCRINAEGNYQVTGRSKENIVLASGKKVVPEDIEKAYSTVPGIKELVVCGVPAAGGSYDEVHAFAVLSDPAAGTETISGDMIRAGSTLPPQMKIVRVHYVDEIPRTSLQKPKRYILKKIAAAELAAELAPGAELSVPAQQKDMEEEIMCMIADAGQMDRSIVSIDAKPFAGLGIDSLQSIELAIRLEGRFGFRVDQSFTHNMTVRDLAALVRAHDEKAVSADETREKYPKMKKPGDYLLFRNVCRLAGIIYKIRVSNEEVIPDDRGYILCANHVSNFDYLWLTSRFNRTRFDKFCCMAKRELLNNTYISRLLSEICGMIPVDRSNIRAETMKCCTEKLKEQWGLLIHPEGTRSADGEMGVFKKGAAVLAIESNVPIIPAYIQGAFDVYPKGSRLPRLFNFRRMRKYAVSVVYGNPIFPGGMTAEEMIQKVRDSITELRSRAAAQ